MFERKLKESEEKGIKTREIQKFWKIPGKWKLNKKILIKRKIKSARNCERFKVYKD